MGRYSRVWRENVFIVGCVGVRLEVNAARGVEPQQDEKTKRTQPEHQALQAVLTVVYKLYAKVKP